MNFVPEPKLWSVPLGQSTEENVSTIQTFLQDEEYPLKLTSCIVNLLHTIAWSK